MLCVRTGGRDREEPHIDAHQGGPGREEGGGRGAGATGRERCKDGGHKTE